MPKAGKKKTKNMVCEEPGCKNIGNYRVNYGHYCLKHHPQKDQKAKTDKHSYYIAVVDKNGAIIKTFLSKTDGTTQQCHSKNDIHFQITKIS